MTKQRRDLRQSEKQASVRERRKEAPERLLPPPSKKKKKETPSHPSSPYLRRKVHRGPRPGISPPSDIEGPVRLLLLALRSSLRRIVPRGRRSGSRVITSSLAARPADERRPEPVPVSASPSREPAVASAGPRGPAEGGKAVGKGLEALAEVGLRGHGFFGCGGARKEEEKSERREVFFLFFALSSSPPEKHFVPINLLALKARSRGRQCSFESSAQSSVLTPKEALLSTLLPRGRRLSFGLKKEERTRPEKKKKQGIDCTVAFLSLSRPSRHSTISKKKKTEEQSEKWRASLPPPRGSSPTSRARQTKKSRPKQKRDAEQEGQTPRPPRPRPAGASGVLAAAEAAEEAARRGRRGRSGPTWSSSASSPCSSTPRWGRAACRARAGSSAPRGRTRTATWRTPFSTPRRCGGRRSSR